MLAVQTMKMEQCQPHKYRLGLGQDMAVVEESYRKAATVDFLDRSIARSLFYSRNERMKLPFLNMLRLLLIFTSAAAVVAKDISRGSKLVVGGNDSWSSPNNLFKLSFIQESEDTYFAAITYNGVPIWKAGGDPGGAVDSSGRLEFSFYGNLMLYEGYSLVWQSSTYGQDITSASLENSGNLVLKNGSVSMWTTFDSPTDTILPQQNFTANHFLSCGLYYFRLSSSGGVSLRWNNSVEYYTTGSLNMTSPSLSMQPEGILLVQDSLNPVVIARGSDYGEASDQNLRFLKLDCDGNVRIYSSSMSDGRGSKIVRWTAVSDQCMVFGYCGHFGICRYDETTANPICGCPSQNFLLTESYKDGRIIRSCDRKVDIQNCQATMLPLRNTLFLTFPPETYSDSSAANITSCRSNCLINSSCIASSFLAYHTGVCYMKSSRFISGYQSPTIASTSYVKVCEPAMPNPPPRKADQNKSVALKIAVVVLGSTLVTIILVSCSWWLYCICRSSSRPSYQSLVSQYTCSDYASNALVQFSYKELQRDTKGFKEKIGTGGFGSVYRGVLPNKTVVAVKQLEGNGIGQGEKQFRMEVATISSTHHLNLVRLIGYCSEGRHRLLVYEFMKNGSLESFLFPAQENKKVLDWACRYSIALGTAKGIMYLHEECRDCILHCDVKPENILLDEKYDARVSDFGFSRLLNLNDHRQRSQMMVSGTRGYIAPEWMLNLNLPITSKADVYSYGMVLLEIVCGKRNFEVSTETDNLKFSRWAYGEFDKGNVGALVDKRLVEQDVDVEQAMRVIQVSFWCIQEQPSLRPTMGKVVQMLEGVADVHKPPPPFCP